MKKKIIIYLHFSCASGSKLEFAIGTHKNNTWLNMQKRMANNEFKVETNSVQAIHVVRSICQKILVNTAISWGDFHMKWSFCLESFRKELNSHLPRLSDTTNSAYD